MKRKIVIFEHGDNYISLYYFPTKTVLEKFIKTIRAKVILVYDVWDIPSYELFERLKKKIDQLYQQNFLRYKYSINTFTEGFSFIVNKGLLFEIEEFIQNLEVNKKEVYDFISSQTKDRAET